jgi:hypothetical protein
MADDRNRPFGMVEVDHDFEVAGRRARRLVDDRDLFLLGATLERVAQAEEPGRDDGTGGRPSEAVDGSVDLTALFGVGAFGVAFGFVIDAFRLVAIAVLHAPTVCRIAGRTAAASGPNKPPSLPVDHGGEP